MWWRTTGSRKKEVTEQAAKTFEMSKAGEDWAAPASNNKENCKSNTNRKNSSIKQLKTKTVQTCWKAKSGKVCFSQNNRSKARHMVAWCASVLRSFSPTSWPRWHHSGFPSFGRPTLALSRSHSLPGPQLAPQACSHAWRACRCLF